jgi:hypothetical protein
MRARLDVLDEVIKGLGRQPAIRRPRWLSQFSIGAVTLQMPPIQMRLERSLEPANEAARSAALQNIGIVVVSATWGHPDIRDQRADVTAKLNDLIDSNGELHFDIEVDVLGDPIFGVQKTLEIVYRVGTEPRIKDATFKEHERVDLPDGDASGRE